MAEGRNKFDFRYSSTDHCSPCPDRSTPNSGNSSRLHRSERSVSGERTLSTPNNSTLCRFFLRGACVYGEHCRYLHAPPIVPGTRVNNELCRRNTDGATTSTAFGTPVGTSRQFHSGRKPPALRKQGTSADSGIGDDAAENWVNAPEFVPSTTGTPSLPPKQPMSYAEAVNASCSNSESGCDTEGDEDKFCPYIEMKGFCEYMPECPYLHGDVCEFCGKACLHPADMEQRKQHNNDCIKQHEIDMEISFAVARSKDKVCGVCMEVIMEKSPGEQRFGILPNCNHCFCLTCIRKWRQAKQFENKIIRACPECRVTSDFVCPSVYWVDTKEEKEKLIQEYKGAMSQKNCKYFKSGQGKCPFGNKCFYLHAYPDGTKADVGPPPRQRRQNADGDLEVLQQIILWDFLDDRDNRLMMIDDLEDFVAFFSDSEESDWSEYDLFYD